MYTQLKSCWLWIGLISLFLACPALRAEEVRYEISYPDLPGYVTLTCDLHMHSVFSDGVVWPTVRVNEGWRQGLDLIAISDHIEHLPHKKDVKINLNRSFDIASNAAEMHGLLFARGAEITRDTPPGHFNAIFTSDNEKLKVPDFVEAVKQANEQGAFVFWNHQGWKGFEKGKWLDVHTEIYEKKWLHGMEVCNGDSYYPDAHRWCLEKNLTMLGNSDIHEPDLRLKSESANHRTMTLVFAKERTLPAMKDALMQGRTAVWQKDRLIGKKEYLEPLFKECVRLKGEPAWGKKAVWLQFENQCSMDIQLKKTEGNGPAEIKLPACSTSLVKLDAESDVKSLKMKYTVDNFLIEPDMNLTATFELNKKSPESNTAEASTPKDTNL
jgi:3',5'-nucleoside bisphosphate phosphatase